MSLDYLSLGTCLENLAFQGCSQPAAHLTSPLSASDNPFFLWIPNLSGLWSLRPGGSHPALLESPSAGGMRSKDLEEAEGLMPHASGAWGLTSPQVP